MIQMCNQKVFRFEIGKETTVATTAATAATAATAMVAMVAMVVMVVMVVMVESGGIRFDLVVLLVTFLSQSSPIKRNLLKDNWFTYVVYCWSLSH